LGEKSEKYMGGAMALLVHTHWKRLDRCCGILVVEEKTEELGSVGDTVACRYVEEALLLMLI
jgi:hypothetical protein